MKEAIITIKGSQNLASGGQDGSEFVTDGEYFYNDECVNFDYLESELTGMEGTQTIFEVRKDMVSLKRVGTVCMQMLFEVGKEHYFMYETPFGTMSMGLDTSSIYSKFDEHGGELEINYVMKVENAQVSRNVFKVCVKEA